MVKWKSSFLNQDRFKFIFLKYIHKNSFLFRLSQFVIRIDLNYIITYNCKILIREFERQYGYARFVTGFLTPSPPSRLLKTILKIQINSIKIRMKMRVMMQFLISSILGGWGSCLPLLHPSTPVEPTTPTRTFFEFEFVSVICEGHSSLSSSLSNCCASSRIISWVWALF